MWILVLFLLMKDHFTNQTIIIHTIPIQVLQWLKESFLLKNESKPLIHLGRAYMLLKFCCWHTAIRENILSQRAVTLDFGGLNMVFVMLVTHWNPWNNEDLFNGHLSQTA